MGLPLQLSSFLDVIPGWLPPTAVAGGFLLLAMGMTREYLRGFLGSRDSYSPGVATTSAVALAASVAAAVYVSVRTNDLVLLFVFFVFVAGRIVQGAIAARIIQKVLEFVFSSGGDSSGQLLARGVRYVVSKLADRLVIATATGIVTLATALSILGVFTVGSGEPVDAVVRFWIGVFFLTVAGLVFDFRYFAHRVSWLPAFGLVIATAGAFLYSPAGFSSYTTVLAPYLESPVPDWMRLPLGAAGFLFGVVLWAVFYTRQSD